MDEEIKSKPPGIVGQNPEEYAAHVFAQLTGIKKWEELEAVEHEGTLYFPEKLYRRKADGKFEGIDVLVKPLRNHEKRKARAEARQIAAKDGIDPEKDPDVFDDLDTMCLLWRAVCSPVPPFEPFALDVKELEERYDRVSLKQLWARIDDYTTAIDPAVDHVDKEQFFAIVAALSEGRSIRPLRVLAGPLQADCVITMAVLLQNFLTSRSSSESSESSTAER